MKGKGIVLGFLSQYPGKNDSLSLQLVHCKQKRVILPTSKGVNDNWGPGSQRLLFTWREALSTSAAVARATAGDKLPPVGHTRWTGPHLT